MRGVGVAGYSRINGAQINLGDLTPYLTYMVGGVCGAVPDAGTHLPPGRGGHPPPVSTGQPGFHCQHFVSGFRIRIYWTFLQCWGSVTFW
jgi:hypothetical protein